MIYLIMIREQPLFLLALESKCDCPEENERSQTEMVFAYHAPADNGQETPSYYHHEVF